MKKFNFIFLFKYWPLVQELNKSGFVSSVMDVILYRSDKPGNPCKSKNYIRGYYCLKAGFDGKKYLKNS